MAKKAKIERVALAIISATLLTYLVPLFSLILYLNVARPTQPDIVHGYVIPIKLIAGVRYVGESDKYTPNVIGLVGGIMFCFGFWLLVRRQGNRGQS